MNPRAMMFGGGPVTPVTLTYRTTVTSNSDVAEFSSYTFSGVAIGTAAPNRLVIIGVGYARSGVGTIDPPTIGGVTSSAVAGTSTQCAVYAAVVPTGTTADIVVPVVGSGGLLLRCAVSVWTVTGLTSTTAIDTATGSVSDGTNSPRTYSDIEIRSGGAFVVFSFAPTFAGTMAASWSGTDSITERVDTTLEAASSYAAYDFAPTQTSTTLDLTMTVGVGTSASYSVTAASFR